jgi:prolyl oligopeptidase
MPAVTEHPPYTTIEVVTDLLHGVAVADPYRWLENQDSPRTRDWLLAQTQYARSYLDSIPGRDRIRDRVRQLVQVETYESLQKVGTRYFFLKRLARQEQPCICFREGVDGLDHVLVDPTLRGTGPRTAVKPLCVSPDGSLLLYEIKEGGERTGTFEILEIRTGNVLQDVLSRGYLRGFAFTPDSRSFYYVHEALEAKEPSYHAAYKHCIGTSFAEDQQVFFAGHGNQLRLHVVAGAKHLGFLVVRFKAARAIDFHLWRLEDSDGPQTIIRNAPYMFGPMLLKDGRVLAATDREAPNFRIVEVRFGKTPDPEFVDVVPNSELPIQSWTLCGDRIFVSYLRDIQTEIKVFDLFGRPLGQVPVNKWDTVRLMGSSDDGNELFFEQESFTKPVQIRRYLPAKSDVTVWAERATPFDGQSCRHTQVWFPAKDGTQIPMFLVGRHGVIEGGAHPTIMTSYGGYGVSMTPQFSVFMAFLIERGCIFALPNIRGGSEFGRAWHDAAKRQHRQVAFDDFLAAAEWLVETGRAESRKLAIFGGSNSGLLVGAAMTQRPDLFRAVVCMVPLLDMLRYHLFNDAQLWKEELGTADDAGDFAALFAYSPYHNVRDGTAYPATMIISGDSDQKCNPLHARKMTARLQAANVPGHPIFLDYSRHRGHSPVLPLSDRIEALTDRMAFLCDQLQLTA